MCKVTVTRGLEAWAGGSWVGLYNDPENVVSKKTKYLSNLQQQTHLPSVLQRLGYTLGTPPWIFSLSMQHFTLCQGKWINNIKTIFTLPTKYNPWHLKFTTILAVSQIIRSWLTLKQPLKYTLQAIMTTGVGQQRNLSTKISNWS